MIPSDQSPKLPMWIFFATDALLIAAAVAVAQLSAQPLSPAALFAIVTLLIAGAIIALVPLVLRYERLKNDALDERQREIESLARTVSSSAEQLSIAAQGLHSIAELAQRNLRQAEQLPHKLQEKIAEFQSQAASVNDAEKEELEKELVALRSSESERLETIADSVAKTTAEWTKLESALQQHAAAATEALQKLSMGTASAIGKAQAAAEQALGQARTEAARHLGEASGTAVRDLEKAKAAALADMEARLTALAHEVVARIRRDLTKGMPTEPSPPVPAQTAATAPAEPSKSSSSASAPPAASTVGEPPAAPPAPPAQSGESEKPPGSTDNSGPAAFAEAARPPSRPRKPRREEPAPVPVEAAANPDAAPTGAAAAEPAPVLHAKITEIAPVAPGTADPFVTHVHTMVTDDSPRATKKKNPRKSEVDDGPGLDLGHLGTGGNDTGESGAVGEKGLSSDGATRLIVTAYIGIGNRLFIRGEGPGLSWDKGVPLQFVSIGKWRWETNDATAPIRFKLLKNDDQECAALGAQVLEPAHQQEVTAAF